MTRHKVVITTSPDSEHRVEVDGHNIADGLRSVNIALGPGRDRPRIEMELDASAIESVRLDTEGADVMMSLPDGAWEALIVLGWTPPAQVRIENHEPGSPEDLAIRRSLGINLATP